MKFKKNLFIAIIVFFLSFLLLTQTSLAAIPFKPNVSLSGIDIADITSVDGTTLGKFVQSLAYAGTSLLVVVSIFFVMLSGVRWIIHSANSSKVAEAKSLILKALMGLVIGIFSVTILSIVNPATVSLSDSISPAEIAGYVCCGSGTTFGFELKADCPTANLQKTTDKCLAGLDTRPPTPTATCTDDLSNDCGVVYQDAYGNDCIGQFCAAKFYCEADTAPCIACKPIDGTCTDDINCCEGTCNTVTNKCVPSKPVGDALGRACDSTNPCPTPLICETNWFNSCGYGKTGHPCKVDDDCAADHYCNTKWNNICVKKVEWGLCDATRADVCPTGYSCINQVFTCTTPDTASNFSCDQVGSVATSNWSICFKNSPTTGIKPCFCDCNSDTDCSGVSYHGADAKFCAFDNWSGTNNICTRGTYGTPCQEGPDCQSGICMTYGKKMCTQGAIGEGCNAGSECQKANKCCKNVCVPDAFSCPVAASDN